MTAEETPPDPLPGGGSDPQPAVSPVKKREVTPRPAPPTPSRESPADWLRRWLSR